MPFFFLSRLGLSFKKLTCVCVCYSSLSYAAAEVTTENKTKEDPLWHALTLISASLPTHTKEKTRFESMITLAVLVSLPLPHSVTLLATYLFSCIRVCVCVCIVYLFRISGFSWHCYRGLGRTGVVFFFCFDLFFRSFFFYSSKLLNHFEQFIVGVTVVSSAACNLFTLEFA